MVDQASPKYTYYVFMRHGEAADLARNIEDMDPLPYDPKNKHDPPLTSVGVK